jgi:hypothetical protein
MSDIDNQPLPWPPGYQHGRHWTEPPHQLFQLQFTQSIRKQQAISPQPVQGPQDL